MNCSGFLGRAETWWKIPVLIAGLMLLVPAAFGRYGILQLRGGYLWDPVSGEYFIPRGFGYQTFNPPVGATQTFPQIEYDLTEFKRMYANSVRLEFVWNQVEAVEGQYDWSKPDFLVGLAEKLGLRLFVLIGFNYAPSWFPESWKSTRDDLATSNVVNYEHPKVRTAYSNYVYQVTRRYRDKGIIAGWIVGNEFAYFDLWDSGDIKHFLGYDDISQGSFRAYLQSAYTNDIARLNANWGSSYADFDSVVMPQPYPAFRTNTPGYFDLVQWRKHSIGEYVAVAARAARRADPNHLVSYSMVGAIFSGNDADYTAEDAKAIVARCAAAGAPLDFWSINNYPRASVGSEQRSADFGVAKYRAQSGLPVLVTETGYSSTEVYGEPERQANALPSSLWEALISGSLGVHLFTWNDRDLYRGEYKPREQGFGIVHQDRTFKDPAYANVLTTFRTMANLRLERLLPGSSDPSPDIQLFWSQYADMVWPRANQENTMIWAALKRLGYQPGLIDDEQLEAGAGMRAPALLLSRCMFMKPEHLDLLANSLVPAGIHLHANGDLPGECDAYGHRNANWAARISSLFGLNVSGAQPGLDSGVTNISYQPVSFTGRTTLGPFSPAYGDSLSTWKIWHGLTAGSGTTIATHTGSNGSQNPMPALQVKTVGSAKTAVNTFALGDTYGGATAAPVQHLWDIRSTWLQAVYRDWFGLKPAIELTGQGAAYVMPDYRPLANGSVLLLLINEDTNRASITLAATNLLERRKIENLTSGSILATNSSGAVALELAPDETIVLYAYKAQAATDPSLINSNPNKLWMTNAPMEVWPNGRTESLAVAFDVKDAEVAAFASFERVLAPNLEYARSGPLPISGRGTLTIPLTIPSPNPQDPWYISSPDGGEYVFHVWLEKNSVRLAESYLPVRLAWPLYVISAPNVVVAGGRYDVTLGWQELPSYLPEEGAALLDRANLWQLYKAGRQYYRMVLELRSAGVVVATAEFLTNQGTDQHIFTVSVPFGATGPFTWTSFLQTAPGAAVDLLDSFENRDTGEDTSFDPPFLFSPWLRYAYPEPGAPMKPDFWSSGVYSLEASDGLQSSFLMVSNPPAPGPYSGFGMYYVYSQPWALPRDVSQWTNYTFAFDFKEASGLPCVLEMQVADGAQPDNGLLHLTSNYLAPGWRTFSANLAQFPVAPWLGHFDAQNVNRLVLNVQMLQTNAVYGASIDNVRFLGPKTGTIAAMPLDLWDGFDDRAPGAGSGLLAPFVPYVYSEATTAKVLDAGIINNSGLNGGAAGRMLVTNPPNAGSWSGFGMTRSFSSAWSLPADTNAWKYYAFSFAFREASRRACGLEMQVKSDANNRIRFTRQYQPDAAGWHTIRATLNQFVPEPGTVFNPAHVESIAVNIQMQQKGVNFDGYFDNVYFDGPDQVTPSGTVYSSIQFTNGPDPNATAFQIDAIDLDAQGHVRLSWQAHSNRVYALWYAEDGALGCGCFVPLSGLTNLFLPTNGILSSVDTNVPSGQARFYRVTMQPR